MKYFLVAVVSVLTTLGLVFVGFLLSRLTESRQAIAPSNTQVNGGANNSPVYPSTAPVPSTSAQAPAPQTTAQAPQAPSGNTGIQPSQFVQSAFGTKG